MTTNDNEIVFEANSGISEEEQQVILEQINGIAEKNRLSLSAGADIITDKNKKRNKKKYNAKKRGGIFPVMVNVAAILILAGGVAALSSFQGKTDIKVREGSKIFGSTERALIDEIRKETSFRLEEKENEISYMTSQLEVIDAELRELHSNNLELTAEQQEIENRLLNLQEDYRSSLINLHDERSQILEESRAREAALRELALSAEQSSASADEARAELERLTREQSQAAIIESQMNELFSNLYDKINDERFDQAADTVQLMRNYLEIPAFQTRSMQTRKELYTNTLDSFEAMINEALRTRLGIAPVDRESENIIAGMQAQLAQLTQNEREFQGRVNQLEQNIAEKDRTINSLNTQGSDATRLLSDSNRLLAERDNQITSLRADLTRQTQAAETNQQTINRVTSVNTSQKEALDKITAEVIGKDIDNMSINAIRESVSVIQEALETLSRQ